MLLVQFFLNRYGLELGKEITQTSPESTEMLRRYSWPGNLRELQSVIKQALLQSTGPVLLPEFLPQFVQVGAQCRVETPGTTPSELDRLIDDGLRSNAPDLYESILNQVKRRLLTKALQETGGNQLRAAKALGISRSTLRNDLKSLGISVERQISKSDDPLE